MDTKNTVIEILNCFETGKPQTDYCSVFIYRDGPNKTRQVTLGRGYTEAGTLWEVFEKYKELGGSVADKLLSYKSEKGKETLPQNKDFIKLVVNTSKTDEKFKDAENQVYDKVYWSRGESWFNKNNFTTPLSMLVIQDSFLQSGSMLQFLTNKFQETTPANGGNEQVWIQKYCETRSYWLAHHSNKILNNTVYRPKFFLDQIGKNNWDLNQFPIFPNGVKVES